MTLAALNFVKRNRSTFCLLFPNILFSNCRLCPKKHPVKSIKHWAAPQGKYTPYEEAIKGDYSEVKLGEKYGPTYVYFLKILNTVKHHERCISNIYKNEY